MDIIIKSWGDELRKLLHGEEETESNLGLEWNFPRLAKYRVTDEKKFFLAVMKYGIEYEIKIPDSSIDTQHEKRE